MVALFEPYTLRSVTMKNRIVVSPMCTYSAAADGLATDWHFVHYGRLAMGGAGMVMLEATSIEARGRHCYSDLGIWGDEHVAPLRRIAQFIKAQGSVAALQLQHSGRKASAGRPWHGAKPLGEEDARLRGEHPWQTVGPSPVPYTKGAPVPLELSLDELDELKAAWVTAAERSLEAGFEVIEIHAAHGYLLNQFLSPLSNYRSDRYGGDLAGRMRWPLEVIKAVRDAWPQDKPLFVRVSSVDGVEEGGWMLDDTVVFARELKALGVDLVDCSSGGIGGAATMNRLARSPGFQVPFAQRVRSEAGIPTIAVGLIMTPELAAHIVDEGSADLIAIGREVLVDPNWPSAARTHLQPERGYTDWAGHTAWWLEKRAQILKSM
jgi:2,4-dienoyl-CoA reductase-like NADH-dependent reductase (Old Yellow Enzyme family)